MAEANDDGLTARRLGNFRRSFSRHSSGLLRRWVAGDSSHHVLPDFLIAGVMKCGTTSLYHHLLKHPGFVPASRKEIHYFSSQWNFRHGEGWYRNHFPTADEMAAASERIGYRAVTGEATPAMVCNSYAINAANLVPDAKIVMILRNPVDRAYSHYHHQRNTFFGDRLSFWDALQAEEQRIGRDLQYNETDPARVTRRFRRYSYARRGMYMDQIEHWLKYFPAEQIKIVNQADLKTQPQALMNTITTFIGLPEHDFGSFERKNKGHYTEPMEERARQYLTELFRPHNRRLFEFLGEDWGWPS